MPEWITQNLGTIIICTILAAFFGILIAGLLKDRKAGKSSCCGGCSGCAMAGRCHSAGSSAATDRTPSEETPDSDAEPSHEKEADPS